MAIDKITASGLGDGGVSTADIADDAITQAKMADDSVGSPQLHDGSVNTAHLSNLNVTAGKIAADAITTAKILDLNVTTGKLAADAVTSAKIADNSVGASELNVSGNGTSGQALLSDADGTMSWGTISQVVSSWKLLYNSNTEVSFSQGGTQLGSLDFYYPTNARIGAAFTKQYDASTSYIVTGGHYYAYASSNLHDHWMWISGDEGNAIHLGDDIYALSGEDGSSPRRQSKVTLQSVFTGKAAGTYTIYTASGSGDTRTHNGVLNRNPANTSGDMSNHNTRSMFWAMEVLYT